MRDGLLRLSLEDFQGGAEPLINGEFFTSSDVRTANAMLCRRGRERNGRYRERGRDGLSLDRRSTGARLLALRSFGKLIPPVRSRSSQAGRGKFNALVKSGLIRK